MLTWKLKRLVVVDGKKNLRPLTKEERKNIPLYLEMLRAAADSRCTRPIFSGYHVKGSTSFGVMGSGCAGNIEYGGYQALHFEEAIGAVRISHEPDAQNATPPIITIVAGHGKGSLETFTMPCGNCRDFLRDTLGENCTIICGTLDGGIAMVATLKDALFEDYLRLSLVDGVVIKNKRVLEIVHHGRELMDNFYHNPQQYPLRNYYVKILTGPCQAI